VQEKISEAYFAPDSPVVPIGGQRLFSTLAALQSAGIKVALNTGYPRNIQEVNSI